METLQTSGKNPPNTKNPELNLARKAVMAWKTLKAVPQAPAQETIENIQKIVF
jgi:hypothetical protein